MAHTPPDFWSELRAGLTQPSSTAVAAALLTMLAATLACALLITEERMVRGAERYFAAGPDDDDAFATASALRAARRHTGAPPLVAVLGGSTTRESYTDAADLARRVTDHLGTPMDAVHLVTDAQTMVETAVLADRLPKDAPGLLVIGVSPWRLAYTPDEMKRVWKNPRLGLSSGVLDAELTRMGQLPPTRTGNYFIDHRGFFLTRIGPLVFNTVFGPIDPAAHRYRDQPQVARDEVEADWAEDRANLEAHAPGHLAVLGALLDRVRTTSQLDVVLLGATLHRTFFDDPLETALYDEYDRLLTAFSDAHGVDTWNLDREAKLIGDDFRDGTHLRSAAAQARYTEVLASRIAERLTAPQNP